MGVDNSSLANGRFFSEQKKENIRGNQEAIDGASSEMKKTTPIAAPGNYLCECASFGYIKDGEERCFPELFISDEKKSLNMTIVLRVIDGTDKVPKGSSIFSNITLCPGGDTFDPETSAKIMAFTKPKLVALTGTTKIELTFEWIEEWLVPKFERKGNSLVLIKDHKMKQQVMAMVDLDRNLKLAVKTIVKAGPGDKSVTYAQAAPVSNMPSETTMKPPTFGKLITTDDSAPADIPHVPDVEDF